VELRGARHDRGERLLSEQANSRVDERRHGGSLPPSRLGRTPRDGRREDGCVDEGLLLLIVGGILAASILVAFGATRAGVPSLVPFLGLGMLLGSDGLGGIEFDDAELARKVGVVALAAILFEGGLATSWRRLREVTVPATLLATSAWSRPPS